LPSGELGLTSRTSAALFASDVVVEMVGGVGFGDGHGHRLVGFVGGTDEQAGSERDIEDGLIVATGSSGGAQQAHGVIVRRRVLGLGLLLESCGGENGRRRFVADDRS
jgi:hypothetical protein